MTRSRDIANLLGTGSVILDGAPSALDTLNELAAALGDDANFASTITTSLNNRVLTTGGSTVTVSTGTTTPLTIQNNGTGNSFVVNDVASDTSPFVIDASGNVGIGGNVTGAKLEVNSGRVTFTSNSEQYSLLMKYNDASSTGNYLGNSSDGAFVVSTQGGGELFRIASSGNVSTIDGAISSGKQIGSFNWLGDIDGAKWSSKLGGYNLIFGNDGTNAAAIESWSFGGRTYRGYVQFTNTGDVKASGNFIGSASINAQTGTSYTLVLTDQSKIIEMNNASANTLTVPTDASVNFPVGTVIDIFQTGAGQTTVGGAGVTINARPGLKLSGQWATATLIKRATNTWLLTGSLSA
jgi:hypothetical protein